MKFFGAPGRMLVAIILFLVAVVIGATTAYMAVGWSLSDSLYMVLVTVYTVGYEEVHPINTVYLHAVTVATMVLGCTGMILFTGALVQALTAVQLQHLFGMKRMTREIDQLKDHVIIVGMGRTGTMLARELKAGGAPFVVLEADPKKAEEAWGYGWLCHEGDATEEEVLKAAGIDRARAIATVLPQDAANVFITLSARSLNKDITIVARGEMPATEGKLRQAGANHVVLPAHIGAERVAQVILYPQTARLVKNSAEMQVFESLMRGHGLETDVVVVPEKGALTGLTIAEIEARAAGRFFVIQLMRKGGEVLSRPALDEKVAAGDGVVIVGRGLASARDLFEAPAKSVRAGRQVFRT